MPKKGIKKDEKPPKDFSRLPQVKNVLVIEKEKIKINDHQGGNSSISLLEITFWNNIHGPLFI